MAVCPTHPDSRASLSIREGEDGRTLIHFFAGCEAKNVLRALGLTAKDLFVGPPPTPEQTAATRALQEARKVEMKAMQAIRVAAIEHADEAQVLVNSLGAKMARNPGDGTLAQAFHNACQLLHDAQTATDDCIATLCAKGASK